MHFEKKLPKKHSVHIPGYLPIRQKDFLLRSDFVCHAQGTPPVF